MFQNFLRTLFDIKAGRIDHDHVGSFLKRPDGAADIFSVSFLHVAFEFFFVKNLSLRLEFTDAALTAFFDVGIQIKFISGVRKNDRAQIAPFSDKRTGFSKGLLPFH